MAKEKKVDFKKNRKNSVVEEVRRMYRKMGYKVSKGTEYGMTDTTLVVHFPDCDIQIKVVAPSAKNGERYEKKEEC